MNKLEGIFEKGGVKINSIVYFFTNKEEAKSFKDGDLITATEVIGTKIISFEQGWLRLKVSKKVSGTATPKDKKFLQNNLLVEHKLLFTKEELNKEKVFVSKIE